MEWTTPHWSSMATFCALPLPSASPHSPPYTPSIQSSLPRSIMVINCSMHIFLTWSHQSEYIKFVPNNNLGQLQALSLTDSIASEPCSSREVESSDGGRDQEISWNNIQSIEVTRRWIWELTVQKASKQLKVPTPSSRSWWHATVNHSLKYGVK